MVGGDTELVMQELVAIRRDLATLMAGMEASAVRQETIIAALEALRADLARAAEASKSERLEPPSGTVKTGSLLAPRPARRRDHPNNLKHHGIQLHK